MTVRPEVVLARLAHLARALSRARASGAAVASRARRRAASARARARAAACGRGALRHRPSCARRPRTGCARAVRRRPSGARSFGVLSEVLVARLEGLARTPEPARPRICRSRPGALVGARRDAAAGSPRGPRGACGAAGARPYPGLGSLGRSAAGLRCLGRQPAVTEPSRAEPRLEESSPETEAQQFHAFRSVEPS